mmetsp:Transcript_19908/g.24393  ORF Transcript_19908/g.24393 Transcript_19908/m.24393 type:complete len:96 (-) Transcript_19908:59-346(-)
MSVRYSIARRNTNIEGDALWVSYSFWGAVSKVQTTDTPAKTNRSIQKVCSISHTLTFHKSKLRKNSIHFFGNPLKNYKPDTRNKRIHNNKFHFGH